jgi:hypothetical protein
MQSPPAAYRILIRWVKIAFHTPSSNLWRRSTTNIEKKLKPKFERHWEKAFYGGN